MTKARKYLIENPVFFRYVFGAGFLVSAGLFIGGFFVPPMGEIHGSILKAAGILLGFGVSAMLPEVIKSGKTATIKHGDTSLTFGDHADSSKAKMD